MTLFGQPHGQGQEVFLEKSGQLQLIFRSKTSGWLQPNSSPLHLLCDLLPDAFPVVEDARKPHFISRNQLTIVSLCPILCLANSNRSMDGRIQGPTQNTRLNSID
jgi:hypothetical protein